MSFPLSYKEVSEALELKNSIIATQKRSGGNIIHNHPTASIQTILDTGKRLSDRGLVGSAVPVFSSPTKMNDKNYEKRIIGSIPVESWLESRFKVPLRLLFKTGISRYFDIEKVLPLIVGVAAVAGLIIFIMFWTSALMSI